MDKPVVLIPLLGDVLDTGKCLHTIQSIVDPLDQGSGVRLQETGRTGRKDLVRLLPPARGVPGQFPGKARAADVDAQRIDCILGPQLRQLHRLGCHS